jgi:hypothetical protein
VNQKVRKSPKFGAQAGPFLATRCCLRTGRKQAARVSVRTPTETPRARVQKVGKSRNFRPRAARFLETPLCCTRLLRVHALTESSYRPSEQAQNRRKTGCQEASDCADDSIARFGTLLLRVQALAESADASEQAWNRRETLR